MNYVNPNYFLIALDKKEIVSYPYALVEGSYYPGDRQLCESSYEKETREWGYQG